MRTHTITSPRPALLLSLLALGALALLVGGRGGQSAAASPAATGAQAITAPETTITKRPPKKVLRRSGVTFEFTANQPGATFECAVDSKPFTPCTSPHKVKVRNGKHVFKVRATVGGVTDATPARAGWHVCVGC
jgi:hypothetical protein